MSPRRPIRAAAKRAPAKRTVPPRTARRAPKAAAPPPLAPPVSGLSRGAMVFATLLAFATVQAHAYLFPDEIVSPVIYLLLTLAYGLAALGNARSWAPWRGLLSAASLPFWVVGIHLSANKLMPVEAFLYYGAAMALAGFAAAAPEPAPAAEDAPKPAWPILLGTLVLAVVTFALLRGALDFNGVDDSVHGAWPYRGITANDIMSEFFIPSRDWRRGLPLLLMPLPLLAFHFGAWRRRTASEVKLILALACLAFVGKLALSELSTQGPMLFGMKVASENNHFLAYAAKLDGWKGFFGFLHDFMGLQDHLGGHLDTHPPTAVAFYLALHQLLGGSAQLVGLAVAALTSLTVLPIFLLGRRLYGSEAGYAGALLYAVSCSSLALSEAGVDCVAALLVACSLWAWVAALQDDRAPLAAWAGLFYGANQYLNFGSSHLLALFGLIWVWMAYRRPGGLRRGLLLAAAFVGGMLLPHLIVWAASGFTFDYRVMIRTALANHRKVNVRRVYGLWVWLNVLLIFAYMGTGLVSAWIARSLRQVGTRAAADPYAIFVLLVFFTQVVSGMARMEVNRQWSFTIVYLAPLAGAAVAGLRGRWTLPLLAVLGLVQAGFIEMVWIDAN